jgi:hypothetical protein
VKKQKRKFNLKQLLPFTKHNDYIIPVYGYLRYSASTNIKHKHYLALVENTILYFMLGMLIAFHNTVMNSITLILTLYGLIVAEALWYYNGWMQKLGFNCKVKGHKAAISYLFTQAHCFGFMVLGYITMLVILKI